MFVKPTNHSSSAAFSPSSQEDSGAELAPLRGTAWCEIRMLAGVGAAVSNGRGYPIYPSLDASGSDDSMFRSPSMKHSSGKSSNSSGSVSFNSSSLVAIVCGSTNKM